MLVKTCTRPFEEKSEKYAESGFNKGHSMSVEKHGTYRSSGVLAV